jgi:hypothetical protein
MSRSPVGMILGEVPYLIAERDFEDRPGTANGAPPVAVVAVAERCDTRRNTVSLRSSNVRRSLHTPHVTRFRRPFFK